MKLLNVLVILILGLILSCSPKNSTSTSTQVVDEVKSAQKSAEEVAMAAEKAAEEAAMKAQELAESLRFDSLMLAKIPTSDNIHIGVLGNGLKYYIRTNEKPEDKVELRLAINAGSILEEDDQQGLAHFLEHMMFNGTKNFEKNQLVDYLQRKGVKFGAHLNAYTSFDETVYMLSMPSEDLKVVDTAMQVLEDWAHNALLTDEEIDKERGVVFEEYRLRLGAQERMQKEFLPIIYRDSRYPERLPIGKKEVIQNFEYNTLRKFYSDWYRPDLMAVAVVGDISVADAESMIKDHFGHIKNPSSPRTRKTYKIPNHKETLVSVTSDKEATHNIVQILFKNPYGVEKSSTGRDYHESTKRRLLALMINQRLGELQNSANPPFLFSQVYYGGSIARTQEAFQAFGVVGENKLENGVRILMEEIKRAKEHGFLDSELDRAKQDMLAGYEKSYNERNKTESSRIVGEYLRNFLSNESIPGIEWEYDFLKNTIDHITVEDIEETANRFIRPDNRAVVLMGPEKEGVIMPTEKAVIETIAKVESGHIDAYSEEEIRSELKENWPTAGTVESKAADDKLELVDLTLSNGVKVTYKVTDFKDDQIIMSGVSKGGFNLVNDENYNNSYFALGAVPDGGLNGLDKTDLGKFLQGNTANVRIRVGGLSERISGSSSPKDLETMLQLCHLYFTDLDKNEEAFQSFKVRRQQFFANLEASPQSYFFKKVGEHRYGDNPRYHGWPTEEDWDNTSYEGAYNLYKERFDNAADFHFYFVGNIEPVTFEKEVAKYLGSLKTNPNDLETFKDLGYRSPSTKSDLTIKRGKDPKSLVQIVFEHPTEFSVEESEKLNALADILSIKLIEILREEKGGVYGVGARANMSRAPYGNYSFSISFPCGPENAADLTNTALEEVQKLIDNGPEQIDIDKIKETNSKSFKKNLRENEFWLSSIENADLYEYNRGSFLEYEEKIAQLYTVEQLQETAKKYLTKDHMVLTLLPEEE